VIATKARAKAVYVLCAIVFAGVGIQIIGYSLTDSNLNPLISPAPQISKFVGYAGIAISFFAPLLSLISLVMFFRVKKSTEANALPQLGSIVGLAVVVSVFEWFWTVGGHPTWFQGFTG
jgi:hypothetical protein